MATSAYSLYQRGMRLIREGRASEAIVALERAAKIRPEEPGIRCALGLALAREGCVERAADEYRLAVASGDGNIQVLTGAADALADLGYDDQAVTAYEEAIRREPTDATAYACLAALLDGHGRPVEAIEVIQRGLGANPDSPDLLLNLGVTFAHLGRHEEAEKALRDAGRGGVNSSAVRYHLGVVLAELGRVEEALGEWRDAVSEDPEDAAAWEAMGVQLDLLGRCVEAEEAFRQVLSLDPEDPAAHNNLGVSLAAQGRSEEAARSYEAAIQLGSLEAWVNLARLRRRHGDSEAALTALQAAVARDPDRGDIRYELGATLEELGQVDEAREQWSLAAASADTEAAALARAALADH